MQTVVQDILVNYTEAGKGDAILCLHGWMHDRSSFDELTKELQAEHKIIALDLPNFGGSELTDSVSSTEDYARFVNAFVQKLQLKSYTLMGHSMGCQIAMYGTGAGILHPKKLILLSPAGVRDSKSAYKKSLKYAAKLLRRFVPTSYKKKFYQKIGSDYNPDLPPVLKRVIDQSLVTDVQTQAKKIKVPTVLICGTEDHDTPLWMAQKLSNEISGSTLDIIKNGDHFAHKQHADTVAEIIRVFLA